MGASATASARERGGHKVVGEADERDPLPIDRGRMVGACARLRLAGRAHPVEGEEGCAWARDCADRAGPSSRESGEGGGDGAR